MHTGPRPASRPQGPTSGSLGLYLAGGIAAGGLYAFANTAFDVLASRGPLVDALAAAHTMVDRGIPLLVGGLLGVAVHYVRLRSALARAEAQRADELHRRLHKTERDQAVWVVAASTLHEVNNPLHTLGLLVDELRALDADDVATRDALVERAHVQMERVREHLGALRSLAAGVRPEPGSVTLDALVSELARDVEPLAEQEGIEVRISADAPVRARGDAQLVRIILENLVANGLEVLRKRGGRGRLQIDVARDADQAIVRVNDDGPGLPADIGSEVFEPLATTKSRGLGLGLSIARALARAMNGDVDCPKMPGWPTTFRLRLPAEAR